MQKNTQEKSQVPTIKKYYLYLTPVSPQENRSQAANDSWGWQYASVAQSPIEITEDTGPEKSKSERKNRISWFQNFKHLRLSTNIW